MTSRARTLAGLREQHTEEERQLVRAALAAADWRISVASETLGLGRSTIKSMITRLGLDDEYRENSPGSGRFRKDGTPRRGEKR